MDERIKHWIWRTERRKRITETHDQYVAHALAEARKAPFPEKVRPAVVSDIVEGAVIWYKECDGEPAAWTMVVDALWGKVPMEYSGLDGHYGLDGAYVEVEDE